MIKLTRVVSELTEEAEVKLDSFQDSLNETGEAQDEYTDMYGRNAMWYVDASIPVPPEFNLPENKKKNYLQLEDEDYIFTYYTIYIKPENIESIEQEDNYTTITMEKGNIWCVKEKAYTVEKKRKDYLDSIK